MKTQWEQHPKRRDFNESKAALKTEMTLIGNTMTPFIITNVIYHYVNYIEPINNLIIEYTIHRTNFIKFFSRLLNSRFIKKIRMVQNEGLEFHRKSTSWKAIAHSRKLTF